MPPVFDIYNRHCQSTRKLDDIDEKDHVVVAKTLPPTTQKVINNNNHTNINTEPIIIHHKSKHHSIDVAQQNIAALQSYMTQKIGNSELCPTIRFYEPTQKQIINNNNHKNCGTYHNNNNNNNNNNASSISQGCEESLPCFIGLPSERIIIIENNKDIVNNNLDDIFSKTKMIGFDTESRPNFIAGKPNTGPHIIQFSTLTHCYIIKTNSETWPLIKRVVASKNIIKVGFDLNCDRLLLQNHSAYLQNTVDLATNDAIAMCIGGSQTLNNHIGITTAVSLVLGQCFKKSKKISISNWASKQLKTSQINYAMADAFGALLVFVALLARGVISLKPNRS
eukprot:UN00779